MTSQRVIVTGAASGIGASVASAFARAGARVAAMDINQDGLVQLAEREEAMRVWRCDVSDKASVDAAFDAAVEWLGGLDVVIHPAGVNANCAADEITPEELGRVIGVNLNGTVFVNQAAYRMMADHGGGCIFNMTSMAGVRGSAHQAHYAAAKGGVGAWTRSVALEWAQRGVRVNAIAPVVETPMATAYRDALDDAAREHYDAMMAQSIPLGGRLGDPARDLAPLLISLAGDAGRFVTGQTIAVDGGFMMLG